MDDGIRLVRPNRDQLLLQPCHLDELLPADHAARTIWSVVERLDVSAFYDTIAARGTDPGRPALDPRLLISLWLYATQEGVGSGRELARRCEFHDAYRWLCGGLSVNYHTLNDFRVAHEDKLDNLFTEILATLIHHGVVRVDHISQDSMRVRASAGSGSFRSRDGLKRTLGEVRLHVEKVKRQMDLPADSKRRRLEAAEARVRRIEAALETLEDLQGAKDRRKDKPSTRRPARASTTDPDARVMRMANGGFSPAYNMQFATDPHSRAIVGVFVTTAGNDHHAGEPMRRQVERRTKRKVRVHLMDGDYVNLEAIERAEQSGVRIYAPPRRPKRAASGTTVRASDGPGVARWRRRMATESAQRRYRTRASTSETVHADFKAHRGLTGVRVRGLSKVTCVALWAGLLYNVLHFAKHLL